MTTFNQEDQVMRNLRNLLIVSTLFISVACTKDLTENKCNLSALAFSAASETLSNVDQTKVHFSDWSTYQLIWDSKDKITVFAEGIGYEFTNSMPDGDRAIFEGSVKPSSSYFALYPYNAEARVASGKIITKFPSTQKAVEYGTDKSAMIAVATENAGTLNFKNVYGILKFNIADEDITSVTLEGNNGEIIAGDIEITLGNEPSYSVTGNKSTEITLTPSGDTFAPGDYAIALLPVEFNEGFKLIFTHSSSSKAAIRATKSEKFSVKRNGGLDAQEMTFESGDYKYYYIRTKEELDAWNAEPTQWKGSDRVYLANDIDYGGGTWVTQTASGTEFKGLFDGRGHSITNIHITSSEHTGFLRRVTGTVKNLTIGSPTDNSDIISTAANAANRSIGVVGMLVGGTVKNVVNYADVNSGTGAGYCGGVVGRMQGGLVEDCKNYGAVSSTVAPGQVLNMSGIVGMLESGENSVTSCENHGAVTYSGSSSEKGLNIGGIIGQITAQASVSESDNYGAITVSGSNNYSFNIGGIAGLNQTTAANISNCENAAAITNHSEAGEICIGGILGSSKIATTISSCVNTSNGVILDDGTCTYAYNSNTSVGQVRIGGVLGSSTADVSISDCTNAARIENNSASVYINIAGILGVNTTSAVSLQRCKNLGYIGSTPVQTSGANQIIRIAGMIAMENIAASKIDACENYGELKLNNTSSVHRSFLAGGVGYADKYIDITNGKYYASVSRNVDGSGKIGAIIGQVAANGGVLKDNGVGGNVGMTTLTADNFGDYLHGQSAGYKTKSGNYFLSERPSSSVVTAAALSHNTDNTSW